MKLLFLILSAYTILAGLSVALAQEVSDTTALRQAADKGDAKAQYQLGFDYHYGLGIKKDDGKAAAWWRKSAEQNYPPGEVMYGAAYAEGWGVNEDRAQTMKWYTKAADQGSGDAMHMLAAIYEFSLRDHARALKLWQDALGPLRLAAEQGDAEAQCDLGTIYNMGWGVEKNDAESAKWRLKAAAQGNPDGEVALALSYRNGWGVPQNDKEALKWLLKSADHGDVEAQKQLGEAYAQGLGTGRDNVQAYKWLTIALAQGYAVAPQVAMVVKTLSHDQLVEAAKESQQWQSEHIAGH